MNGGLRLRYLADLNPTRVAEIAKTIGVRVRLIRIEPAGAVVPGTSVVREAWIAEAVTVRIGAEVAGVSRTVSVGIHD